MIEAYKIILQEKASVRRAEEIARRMKKKIEEGIVPITKENLPQFLKSKLDRIGEDLQSTFEGKQNGVKISQTNVATRIIIEFKGPVEQRFDNIQTLYKKSLWQKFSPQKAKRAKTRV